MKRFLVAAMLLAGLGSAALANAVEQLAPIYESPHVPYGPSYGGRPLLSGSYLYTYSTPSYLMGGQPGLTVLDVSNPAAPTRVAILPSVPSVSSIVSFGRYLFIGGGYLYVVDAIDPTAPVLANQLPTPPAMVGDSVYGVEYLAISGNYLVATWSNYGIYGPFALKVFDFSVATAPVLVASLALPEYATDLAISGQYAFVTTPSGKLQVIDISKPTAPRQVASLSLGTGAFGVALSGNYAYVTTHGGVCDYDYCGAIQGQLNVVDVSNPLCPRVVSSIWTNMAPFHLVLSGRYAYVSEGSIDVGGADCDFSVVDVGNPTAPQLVAFGLTGGGELAVSSTNVYVMEGYWMDVFPTYGGTTPIQACTQ